LSKVLKSAGNIGIGPPVCSSACNDHLIPIITRVGVE
jgi:hypothetical protein